MSSITASANRNDRSDATALLPTKVSNPTAKAISVATGIPHPLASTEPAIIK
ncbi:unannotated protein [freshwater metagenome]|uniref:Unannotated protein n=1 Tax=freshwater metagenome TaxID=449393 RepID=A0A6J6V5H1_9ZZZZ